jgi:RNA polymerase sigma factor (sigma-70 family)
MGDSSLVHTDAVPGPRVADEAARIYTEHRQPLFSVVYGILGSVADAEDVLQETWLSWEAAQRADIVNPRRYLLRIAVNHALARLRWLRRSREDYVGPWLPEPLVSEDDIADGVMRTESVSLAMMVLLETLTPLERAVFVLREAFGYDSTEIASLLGRTDVAVRQLAHRARERVHARDPRYKPDPQQQRAATQRFLTAALGGDIAALLRVLCPDVTLVTDGGGKRKAALRTITGRDKIARLVAGRAPGLPAALEILSITVNGEPGALAVEGDGTVFGVITADLDPVNGCISAVYVILNPDKLARVRLREGTRGGLSPEAR